MRVSINDHHRVKALRLEVVGQAHTRIVPEGEFLTAVEGVARPDALCVECVERLDEKVFDRHISCADTEAADAVEVAVGQIARAVAAEERAVLKMFVVGKDVPAALDCDIAPADVKAQRPEMRCAAHSMTSDVELIRSRRVLIDRMPVHMAAERRAVLTVVNRHRGIFAHFPFCTDTDDACEMRIVIDVVALAVRMFRVVIFASR